MTRVVVWVEEGEAGVDSKRVGSGLRNERESVRREEGGREAQSNR
jgi:hypothetical protein